MAALLRILIVSSLLLGCAPPAEDSAPRPSRFDEQTNHLGLNFFHHAGRSEKFDFPEIMGSGVAMFDYDLDGDLDLYWVQAGSLRNRSAIYNDQLFENRLIPDGALAFVDVTDASGIAASNYGMSVSVGDVDGDRWPHLFLGNFGDNQLWRNRGDGTFEDWTERGGVQDSRWTTAATFADIDRDGDDDLITVQYADFRIETAKSCFNARSAIDYCSPKSFPPTTDSVWLNDGAGRFTDISRSSGIESETGAGLGIVAADFNGDQQLDVYVANDGGPNRLWIGDGRGRFEDRALLAGCALNRSGEAEASMGVDAADFDDDGDLDLFMTHLTDETNTLYLNDGSGWFGDASADFALGASSRPYTGFGTAWDDLDMDGDLDLVAVNGAVFTIEGQLGVDSLPFRQPNQIFWNDGDQFREELLGRLPGGVSRGLALGDLDNDGDSDLVIQNLDEGAEVWINGTNPQQRWLGLILPVGYRVEYDGLHRRARRDGSYASSQDPRVRIAVRDDSVREVRIIAPSGASVTWRDLEFGRYLGVSDERALP